MKEARLKRLADAGARAALVIYAALTLVVIRLHPMSTGLDPSWAVGLNYFRNAGFVHGRDIAFTYGPLSFLTLPMDSGDNLILGAAFQAGAWIAFVAVLATLAYARSIGAASLAVFALGAFLGTGSFHNFGYAGPEVFVAFLSLLLLGGALEGRFWWAYYAAATAVAALLTLIKWSAGMHALSAVLAFPLAMALFDRGRALTAAAIGFLGGPAAIAGAYLAYNPSIGDMGRYIRAGLELSAGHSAAQSLPADPRDLAAALLFAGAYLVFLVSLYALRLRSFVLAFAVLGPLFVEFKHSFIRPPGHAGILFAFVPLAVGIVFLFTKLQGRARWVVLALIPMTAALRYREPPDLTWQAVMRWPEGVRRAGALGQIARFEATRARLAAESANALAADRLPPELLARIGGATVTAFPWECAYAAANPIRFVPLPVFSGFMAYTPFLDGWNASFLGDAARAPRFVLLEWSSIDDRNPLLDAPQTFTALYQHYGFGGLFGKRLLLRRRDSPRFREARFLGSRQVRMGDPARLPEGAGARPAIARVDARYNTRGRLLRFLYQIPEMRAVYASEAGAAAAPRCSTETAIGGLPLNFLPSSLAEAVALFHEERLLDGVDSLVVSGPGRANFESPMRVDFYEFPAVTLGQPRPRPPPPELSSLTRDASLSPGRIELLGGIGVVDRGPEEVIDLSGINGYVEATGWAVGPDGAAAAGSVWIQLDGRLHPARLDVERPDIAALLRGPQYLRSGFRWIRPAWELGAAEHRISLVVISGSSYRELTPRRFRVARGD